MLLYELLTGSTPFEKERFKQAGYDEMRRIIREEEPPRPSTRIGALGQASTLVAAQRKSDSRRLGQLLRGDLDWIVMKALEKDRTRRYETASGLAADVRRYLNDEPVEACPPSAAYRFRKFARRNKRALASVTLLGMILFVAVVALGTGFVLITQQKAQTEQQRAIAEEKAARLQQRLYAADIRLAYRFWTRGDIKPFERILAQYQPQPGKEDLRGFEWHYLDHLARMRPTNLNTFQEHEGDVYAALVSPDGKALASAGKDGTVRLRDLAHNTSCILGRHQGAVNFLTFAPKGELLASASDDKTVKLWDVATGKLIDTLNSSTGVGTIGFSPDGQTLSAGGDDGLIRLWEVATHRPLGELKMHGSHVHFLHHSPDGRSLASCDRNGCVIVWDFKTRCPRLTVQRSGRPVYCVCFSPDSSLLATGGEDGEITFWRADNGEVVTKFGQHLKTWSAAWIFPQTGPALPRVVITAWSAFGTSHAEPCRGSSSLTKRGFGPRSSRPMAGPWSRPARTEASSCGACPLPDLSGSFLAPGED